MEKFIYVFGKKDMETLVADGYTLVQSDSKNDIYVFENKPGKHFSLSTPSFAYSNTLTF